MFSSRGFQNLIGLLPKFWHAKKVGHKTYQYFDKVNGRCWQILAEKPVLNSRFAKIKFDRARRTRQEVSELQGKYCIEQQQRQLVNRIANQHFDWNLEKLLPDLMQPRSQTIPCYKSATDILVRRLNKFT